MSLPVICLIMFLAMAVMILLGIPLSVSMLTCTFVGMTVVNGFGFTINQFSNGLFALSNSYTFAVIPMFMIVGTLCSATGIAEDTFEAAKKWLGRVRCGLLHTVVVANMIFGACSGMSAAGNMVFSKMAMPELRKANYNETMSIGTITAAGSLSVLIPPSIPLISFCLLANVSVGASLVTGVACGILFAFLMCVMNHIISIARPDLVPPPDKSAPKVPLREKLGTLKLLIPILLLFALIVGGSFLGWFPATAGGAVAVVAVLVYAVAKRTPFKVILNAIVEGIVSFAGVYLIIVAGQFFGRFVTLTGMATYLSEIITSAHIPAYAVFCLVVLFYLFCGCFMDCLSIIVITVPVIFPVLTAMGFHELILVLLLVFAMEIASLTPPVGVGVFYVAHATGMPTSQIFKGVTPYFLFDLFFVLLIGAVPQLVLWLPQLMGY